jgi:type II secretory pathway pseudopilin PulG
MRNPINKCESGLTLIEMLTAVSVIIIMAGTTFAVFSTAIDAYQRNLSKVLQSQRTRVALDQISTDLSQMQADTSDEMLAIFSQDGPTSSGDRDILSFVTLVKTDLELFDAQVSPAKVSKLPLSDVRRVAYYVGPKIPLEARQSGTIIPPPLTASQQTGDRSSEQEVALALYRVVTTALDPEFVINSFMDSGIPPTVDESGIEIDFKVSLLIDGIINFDLKYFDEESLYESWDQTDAIPFAIQVLVSVVDEERQESTATQTIAQNPGDVAQGALTQSTMVYIPASANVSEP